MRLTGRKKALVHAGNAASFGFFDVPKNVFMTEELYKMGVEEQWLPQVCTGTEALGSYRERIVTTAIGDNQASFLGAAGNENNTLLVNMEPADRSQYSQISILQRRESKQDLSYMVLTCLQELLCAEEKRMHCWKNSSENW